MGKSVSHPKRKTINWQTVRNCTRAQCTLKETSAILGVCENTLRERCLEEKGVSLIDFVETSRIAGKASLRRKLFKMANGDNFPALKFALGNYLKMYEKNELVVAAKYTQYTDEEREMLRRLAMEKAQAELEAGRVKAIEHKVQSSYYILPKKPPPPETEILNAEYPVD